MADLWPIFLYYGKLSLTAAAILSLLVVLAIPGELYKERISLSALSRLFTTPGIYLRLMRNMLPGMIAIGAALFIVSSFVASLYKLHSRREGLRHIGRCVFGQPSFSPSLVASDAKIKANDDHVLMRIGGPGSIVTHFDSAVVLERGSHPTRIVGPGKIGTALLSPFEKVYAVIDVRPMRWSYPVKGLSKEGIPVTLYVDVEFQIDTGDRRSTDDTPYPARDEAIFRAAVCQWMRDPEAGEDDQYFDWARRVIIGETEGTVRTILAHFPLDALVGLTSSSTSSTDHPREDIQRKLEKKLRESTPALGVQINRVRLGKFEVGDKVANQWIEAWRNEWQHWAIGQEKAGEATRERLREIARAQAQVDMITAVAGAIRQSTTRGTCIPSQLLVMRLIEVFDRFRPLTYLPGQAIETLDRLRELVG